MGPIRARRIHKFTVPCKWAWLVDAEDETAEYTRIGNVYRFDPSGKETLSRKDLERDWDGDMDEADQW